MNPIDTVITDVLDKFNHVDYTASGYSIRNSVISGECKHTTISGMEYTLCFLITTSDKIIEIQIYQSSKSAYIRISLEDLLELDPIIDECLENLKNHLPKDFKIKPYCKLDDLSTENYVEYARNDNKVDPFGNTEILKLAKQIGEGNADILSNVVVSLIDHVDINAEDNERQSALDLLFENKHISGELKAIIESIKLKQEVDDEQDITRAL